MLEQPHLDFTHQPAQARGGGTGRLVILNSPIEHVLGIAGRYVKSVIDDAIEISAPAGEQADAGVIPNAIEIGGQGIGFRPAEG
jgi:hypothetical protein